MTADTPRPTPAPAHTAAPAPTAPNAPREPRSQISANQYIRLQAARISAEYHRSRATVKDAEIVKLADRLELFIRTGKTGD